MCAAADRETGLSTGRRWRRRRWPPDAVRSRAAATRRTRSGCGAPERPPARPIRTFEVPKLNAKAARTPLENIDGVAVDGDVDSSPLPPHHRRLHRLPHRRAVRGAHQDLVAVNALDPRE